MINHVVLVGRVTSDPDMRYTPNGVPRVAFKLAVQRPYSKSASGERETDFIWCVSWRQQAEFVASYIAKGRIVGVEGRLRVYEKQDPDGKWQRDVVVDADRVTAIDAPKKDAPPIDEDAIDVSPFTDE